MTFFLELVEVSGRDGAPSPSQTALQTQSPQVRQDQISVAILLPSNLVHAPPVVAVGVPSSELRVRFSCRVSLVSFSLG